MADISKEDLKGINVYDLALDLIDSVPKASFFFDECPLIASPRKCYESGGKMKISLFGSIHESL